MMEQTECSETSAYKIQKPGNYPEENIQHTEHGESLKSRMLYLSLGWPFVHAVFMVWFSCFSIGSLAGGGKKLHVRMVFLTMNI